MNSKLFKQWLGELNAEMRAKDRHILLMLDNAASHGKEADHSMSHVKVKFLPASSAASRPRDNKDIQSSLPEAPSPHPDK